MGDNNKQGAKPQQMGDKNKQGGQQQQDDTSGGKQPGEAKQGQRDQK